MKAFKRYGAARQAANGGPIVKVGAGRESVYVVGGLDSLTEIALIDGSTGSCTSGVTLRHLDRLGNANWAQAAENQYHNRKRIWAEVKW